MSNLIKSSHVVSLDDLKRLEFIRKSFNAPQNISAEEGETEGNPAIDVETQSMKERILSDAESAAEEIVHGAREDAARIREEAEQEAESWWQERRGQDEQYREEAMNEGFETGLRNGIEHGVEEARQQWEEQLREAQRIVEQAYATKESVIAEAEAFLVELSCQIAEKIVGDKMAEAPETALKLYAKTLSRRKELGTIVLCVSPKQFSFVQAAKEELQLSIDPQAILQIVPDAAVTDGGCIVRSSFGSIDARVDTQLEEIREQLLRIAAHSAEEAK